MGILNSLYFVRVEQKKRGHLCPNSWLSIKSYRTRIKNPKNRALKVILQKKQFCKVFIVASIKNYIKITALKAQKTLFIGKYPLKS